MERKDISLKSSSGVKRKKKDEDYSSHSEKKERTTKQYKKKRSKHKFKSKHKTKRESSCRNSSHSGSESSSTSSEERKRKKHKKAKRKKHEFDDSLKNLKESEIKFTESDTDDVTIGPLPPKSNDKSIIMSGSHCDDVTVGPILPSSAKGNAKSMAPMTKDEWEKRQSVVKRVLDEESGRWRLVKGDGEILEEIVSRDRHKEINRQATAGDGLFFQSKINDKVKRH